MGQKKVSSLVRCPHFRGIARVILGVEEGVLRGSTGATTCTSVELA